MLAEREYRVMVFRVAKGRGSDTGTPLGVRLSLSGTHNRREETSQMATRPTYLTRTDQKGWQYLRGKHVRLYVPTTADPDEQLLILAELSEAATALTQLTYFVAAHIEENER